MNKMDFSTKFDLIIDQLISTYTANSSEIWELAIICLVLFLLGLLILALTSKI